jgi:hypothetical protein
MQWQMPAKGFLIIIMSVSSDEALPTWTCGCHYGGREGRSKQIQLSQA